MLVKQKKENKLSTTFGDVLYKVTNKYSNKVTVMAPEGVDYRRNVTDVKKYLEASDGPDQPGKGVFAEAEVLESPPRPTRERRTLEYLKDYELH